MHTRSDKNVMLLTILALKTQLTNWKSQKPGLNS